MDVKIKPESLGSMELEHIAIVSRSRSNSIDKSISSFDCNNNITKWLEYSQSEQNETDNKEFQTETMCRVCGDVSSGRHYGQYTCDGCSGFFMRSVRKNMVYRCKGNQKCIVDKKRRNQCQACRFEKCLKVNMNRYAVQQERQPNNQFTFTQTQYSPQVFQYLHPQRPGFFLNAPHHLISTNVACARTITENSGEAKHYYNEDTMMKDEQRDSILDLSSRLLYHTVKWSKSVPAFSELPMHDQIKLLESSWTEIFLLFTFQWNLIVNTMDILRNVNLKLSETELQAVTNELRYFEKLSQRFQHLKVTEDEFIYLKSIVLFKPETRGLIDATHIERCQDRAQVMLRDYVMSQVSNQPARFGKLLLLLPEIKLVTPKTLEGLLFQQPMATVSFESLLSDIFKK